MRAGIPTLPQSGKLPEKEWFFNGFNLGNNTFALATELKGSELASMVNIELYGKRSLRPVRGGSKLGADVGDGTQIDGLFQFKDKTTDVNDALALSNGTLYKYNATTEAWDAIAGSSFTANLRTRATKLRGALYFGNGTDDFTKYAGTSLATFSAVAAPTGLAVAAQGTTGTTPYAYTITTVTGKGQSLPATVVTISDGNATLSPTDFNRVTFNRRTESQVIGYNVFGRNQTGTGVTLMKYIPQPASGATVTFDDDGTITPQIWQPPDGDSTDGIKAALWEQLKGSLVAAKVNGEEHRLFFSGTGDKYESFSPAHNGGWVDVRAGDNDDGINGFAPFESKIIVAKENSIHQFYFDVSSGDAIIQELITYVGCGAPGSMIVMENDVAFIDSERRLRILGYEPNFAAAIRTTSLSEGRVQSLFDEIDPAYLANSEAVYFDGKYHLAVTGVGSTVNDRVLTYDRRYLAFLGKRTGRNAHVRSWLVWDGYDGRKRLFAGASDDNVIFQYGEEGKLTDYDNSAVTAVARFRNEDLGNSGQQKIWKWADFRIFRIQGTLKITTILDGTNTLDTKSFSSQYRTGWGVKRWGVTKWGVSTGVGATASDLDNTYRKELFETANSLQFEVQKDGALDDFILVSMRGEAFLLPTSVFDSSKMI